MIGLYEFATRTDLLVSGISRRTLASAVAAGLLIRARRDRYIRSGAPQPLLEAVRLGGRLTCLSLLQILGVFVHSNTVTHVHVARGASRLRSATDRTRPLEPRPMRLARVHWAPLLRPPPARSACVDIVDALVHAVQCQPARYAVASLDSALHRGLIGEVDLAEIFAALPRRFAVIRHLTDARSESGTETLVRLMARTLGCRVDLQVFFAGVGRVDLVIDGWLVVECDSKEFHESWAQQAKDRARDAALAARGYATLRLTAADVLYRPDEVLAALRGLTAAHPRCRVA